MTVSGDKSVQAVHLLAAISRLGLKGYRTKDVQSLIFLILNDTHQIIRYNRAALWEFNEHGIPTLLGISGTETINKRASIIKQWEAIVKDIHNPEIGQTFSSDTLNIEKTQEQIPELLLPHSSIAWLPIFAHGKLALGLWLERWHGQTWEEDEIEILNFLMQNYGAAWEKFKRGRFFFDPKKYALYSAGLIAALISLFVIHLPLRVVGPCEVIPDKPFIITAPLEGIIESIVVQPGQNIKKDELLFLYDAKVPEEELKVAQKQMQIIQAEINRAKSLAFRDKKALAELAILQLKQKKEQVQLDLANYKVTQLKVRSPIEGVVILEDPDEWRGHPVRVGEKVLMVSDPNFTKIRIWIPESDNILLNREEPIKVILNINPNRTYLARIKYVAANTVMNDKGVPSVIAEAEWIDNPKDVKLGLKGTAIMYGEEVTLFYWLARRPWTSLRHLFGL